MESPSISIKGPPPEDSDISHVHRCTRGPLHIGQVPSVHTVQVYMYYAVMSRLVYLVCMLVITYFKCVFLVGEGHLQEVDASGKFEFAHFLQRSKVSSGSISSTSAILVFRRYLVVAFVFTTVASSSAELKCSIR